MGRFAKQNMLRMFFVFLFCEIGKCSRITMWSEVWFLVLKGASRSENLSLRICFFPKAKKSLTLYLGYSNWAYYKTAQDTAASLEKSKGLACFFVAGWLVCWSRDDKEIPKKVGLERIVESSENPAWWNYCEILSLEMWIWFDHFFLSRILSDSLHDFCMKPFYLLFYLTDFKNFSHNLLRMWFFLVPCVTWSNSQNSDVKMWPKPI